MLLRGLTVPGGLGNADELLGLLVRGIEGVDEGVHAGAVSAVGNDGGGAGVGGAVGGVGGGVLVEAEVPVGDNGVSFIVTNLSLIDSLSK